MLLKPPAISFVNKLTNPMRRSRALATNTFFLLTALVLFSCKKSGKDNEPMPGINPTDGQAVSAAVKVWHSSRITGQSPTPSINPSRPELDPASNDQKIYAVAGRYAVIRPTLLSGNIAGYYLHIDGANDYFKIDYSLPAQRISNIRERKLALLRKKLEATLQFRGMDSTDDGNGILDSTIVINIPSTIQPGTFCVTYYVYDSSGLVSDPVETCITVESFGGDATTANYLAGKWKLTASRDSLPTAPWEPFIYEPEVQMQTFFCNYDSSEDRYYASETCNSGSCPSFIDTVSYTKFDKLDLSFTAEGGLSEEYKFNFKNFGPGNNNCNELETYFDFTDEGYMLGAWSYNASTNKLILIVEFVVDGQTDAPWVDEFTFIKDSDQQLSLFDSFGYGTRLQKY